MSVLHASERLAAIAALPDDRIDLAEAALLIVAGLDEPGPPDAAACLRELDALARSAADYLRPHESARTRLEALGRFLFEQEGFRGNAADYYDARNSFLHEVLRRRTGIPITMALLYLELGKRLGLPLEGVNFPGHFLVRHTAPQGAILIDPFSGNLMDEAACTALLERMGAPTSLPAPEQLRTAPPRLILRRMLTNLKLIYLQQGAWTQALTCMERILLLAPDDPGELRDRGLLHHRLECFAEAAADLERYLELAGDDATGAESVRPVLADARRRAGRLS